MSSSFAIPWVLLALPLARSAAGEDVPAPPELYAAREKVLEGIRKKITPSLAVAVVKDDRLIWAEGFGLADIEANRKATPGSIYRLASISKPITATGLMVLVDRGLIDLDRPANYYLEGAKLRSYAGSDEEITLRRLASHTAGLPVHYNFYYPGSEPLSPDETIRRYGFAAWRPGSRSVYSNLGFGLLGFITERKAGAPWGRFLEKEVFDPLGMSATSDRVRPGREGDATAQYSLDAAGRFVRVEPYVFDHPGGSIIWSSVLDLARFARMHLNGGALEGARVLKEESALAMRTLPPGSRTSGTAIGWAVETHRGRPCFWHSGGMPGVATMLRVYPQDKTVAVALVNSESSLAADTVDRIAEALLPDPGNAPADRSDSEPEAESPPLAGNWEGRLEHFSGPILVALKVEENGTIELSLNGRSLGRLRDASVRGRKLRGRLPALLETQRGFHGVPELEFSLERREDLLVGVCTAAAPRYFALSYYVELARKKAAR